MAEEKTPLSPRETALRMIDHLPDDVSYEDIIRQLRILIQIDWVMNDVETAGYGSDAPSTKIEKTDEDVAPPVHVDFQGGKSSLVLRSRPLFNWRSLAERSSDDRSEPFTGKASWIY